MSPNTLTADIDLQRSQPLAKQTMGFKPWERTTQALLHLPQNVSTIIDVGCAFALGSVAFKLAFPSACVVGIDCVPERLNEALAARRLDSAQSCFFQDAALAADSADVVYAGEVIEHVDSSEAELFVAKAYRILRPGGLFILTTPNPHYIRLWLTRRKVTDEPSHLSEWTPGALKRLVRSHGFRVVRCHGTGKVSRSIGTIWPIVPLYGSYMLVAKK